MNPIDFLIDRMEAGASDSRSSGAIVDEMLDMFQFRYKRVPTMRGRLNHERKDWEELRAAVDAFELASGVEITSYNGRRIGEAVRTVMEGREASYAARLRYIGEQAQHLSDAVQQALAAPSTQPGGAA